MAPYIGQSKVLMKLAPAVASGLLAGGTVVEVPEGATASQIDAAWERKFGAVETAEASPQAKPQGKELEKPRGNASRDDWVAYALANGLTEDDLAGKKQSEIRELFDGPGKDADEQAKAKADADAAEAKAKADAEAKAKADTEAKTGSTDGK